MNIKKLTVSAFAAMASATLTAAVPEVSNVTMAQDPTRLVTISYNLSEEAVVTLDVQTNTLDGTWYSIGGAAISGTTTGKTAGGAKGDVWKKVSAGSGKSITWRPDMTWPDHKIADGGARAVVTAWALDNTPDYMAVDITATGGAGTETYYPGADFVPGGVTNSLYKTGSLLMRKIMAKDVTWMMGSVAESGRADNETAHQVTLTNNYYIGVYEVTQTQWQQITGYNISNFTTDQTMRPVEKVSYTEIRQANGKNVGTASKGPDASGGIYPAEPYGESFLGLLRTRTGLDFDLPSEAQWEFAARAGHGEGYWGDGSPILSSDKDANLNLLARCKNNPTSNSSTNPNAAIAPSVGGTAIVGSYAPNDWGLYDVYGNVCEWCLDWYAADITALNGAVNTTSGANRLNRGGAWGTEASEIRPAYRNYTGITPTFRNRTVGFRVACTAGLQ